MSSSKRFSVLRDPPRGEKALSEFPRWDAKLKGESRAEPSGEPRLGVPAWRRGGARSSTATERCLAARGCGFAWLCWFVRASSAAWSRPGGLTEGCRGERTGLRSESLACGVAPARSREASRGEADWPGGSAEAGAKSTMSSQAMGAELNTTVEAADPFEAAAL